MDLMKLEETNITAIISTKRKKKLQWDDDTVDL